MGRRTLLLAFLCRPAFSGHVDRNAEWNRFLKLYRDNAKLIDDIRDFMVAHQFERELETVDVKVLARMEQATGNFEELARRVRRLRKEMTMLS